MMELIGGTLVLLAMGLCGATICAGGLCTEQAVQAEPKRVTGHPGDAAMPRSRRMARHRRGFGMVVLATIALTQAAFAEQPLKQLPRDVTSVALAWTELPQAMVEVTHDDGPLAGMSWGLLKGSSEAVGRVVSLLDQGPASERLVPPGSVRIEPRRSPAWLNAGEWGTRHAQREPVLLRYTF